MDINFVYLTTNLINNKQYIGDHSCNVLENDLYLGSGSYYKAAEKLYGKQNFIREILEFFSTKQEAFNAQEKYIIQYNTLSPNGYNISPKGGHNVKGCISEETRKKLSESHKGLHQSKETIEKRIFKITGLKRKEETKQKMRKPKSEEHRKHLSESRKGILHTEESKRKNSESHKGKPSKRKGIKLSDEQKQNISKMTKLAMQNPQILEKISKSQTGKIHSKEHNEKISNSLRGRTTSPEHSKHLSESLKNRIFSEETKKKMSIAKKGKVSLRKGIKHTDETKRKISESKKVKTNVAILSKL